MTRDARMLPAPCMENTADTALPRFSLLDPSADTVAANGYSPPAA
jgi:hypothetical protein